LGPRQVGVILQLCFTNHHIQLTCASVGKGQRLALHTQSEAYKARHPRPFFVMPGFSDILLPALVSHASGCITGTGTHLPPSEFESTN
jgi:hypothetical protein